VVLVGEEGEMHFAVMRIDTDFAVHAFPCEDLQLHYGVCNRVLAFVFALEQPTGFTALLGVRARKYISRHFQCLRL